MKASKFSDPQKAFILKQDAEGMRHRDDPDIVLGPRQLPILEGKRARHSRDHYAVEIEVCS